MWAKSMRAEREDCSIIAGGIGCIGGIIRSSPVAGNLIAVAKDRIEHGKTILNIIKTKYFKNVSHIPLTCTTSGQQRPIEPRKSVQGFDGKARSSGNQTEHWLVGLQPKLLPHGEPGKGSIELGPNCCAHTITQGKINKFFHISKHWALKWQCSKNHLQI